MNHGMQSSHHQVTSKLMMIQPAYQCCLGCKPCITLHYMIDSTLHAPLTAGVGTPCRSQREAHRAAQQGPSLPKAPGGLQSTHKCHPIALGCVTCTRLLA
jgi:hypothetical protein